MRYGQFSLRAADALVSNVLAKKIAALSSSHFRILRTMSVYARRSCRTTVQRKEGARERMRAGGQVVTSAKNLLELATTIETLPPPPTPKNLGYQG
jgi:hypothetical protein